MLRLEMENYNVILTQKKQIHQISANSALSSGKIEKYEHLKCT